MQGCRNPIDAAPTTRSNKVIRNAGIFKMLRTGKVSSPSINLVSESMSGNIKNAIKKKNICTPPTAKKGNVKPPIYKTANLKTKINIGKEDNVKPEPNWNKSPPFI